MKNLIALALMILLVNPSCLPAVDGHKAAYASGTITRFNVASERIEGRIDIGNAHDFVFIPDAGPHAAQPLRISYKAIRDLEFGQKAGRRALLAAGATAFLGPIGLLSLFAKSRTHYLTVAYADDDGKTQVAFSSWGRARCGLRCLLLRRAPVSLSSTRTKTPGNGAWWGRRFACPEPYIQKMGRRIACPTAK